MATVKRRHRHLRVSGLTDAQTLELLIGPGGFRGGFADEESRRRAWHEHRTELMALLPPDGRGWGWVRYEGGGFLPGEGSRVSAALARIRGKQ